MTNILGGKFPQITFRQRENSFKTSKFKLTNNLKGEMPNGDKSYHY